MGARAILENHSIDFLYDRQNIIGSNEEEKAKLATWLDSVGIPKLREYVKNHHINTNEDHHIYIEDHGYFIEGNPCKSYGYLYVGAGKCAV